MPRWPASHGQLLLPTGSLQDESAILETARSTFGRLTELDEGRVPLSSALSSAEELLRLACDRVVGVARRGSRLLFDVRIWEWELATAADGHRR